MYRADFCMKHFELVFYDCRKIKKDKKSSGHFIYDFYQFFHVLSGGQYFFVEFPHSEEIIFIKKILSLKFFSGYHKNTSLGLGTVPNSV